MSLKFRLTETKKGVWIYCDDVISENVDTMLFGMPIWNSFNSKRHEWVIKRKDLSQLIDFLRRNQIHFEPLGSDLVKSCNVNTVRSKRDIAYVCHPATGRWVKRNGFIGQSIIHNYPESTLLPPYHTPSTEEMVRHFDTIKLDTVCAYFLDNMLAPGVIIQKRTDIAKEWILRHGITENSLKTEGGITSENLIALFELIDREFFNNKIQEYLIQTKRHVSVIPSNRTNTNGVCAKDTHFGDECVFQILINMNNVIEAPCDTVCIKTPDFDVCDRVVYLQLILENEIAKFISLVFCNKEDHETLYVKLLKNMFGQSSPPPVFLADGTSVNITPPQLIEEYDTTTRETEPVGLAGQLREDILGDNIATTETKTNIFTTAKPVAINPVQPPQSDDEYFQQMAEYDAQYGGAKQNQQEYRKLKHQITFQWRSHQDINSSNSDSLINFIKEFDGSFRDVASLCGKVRFGSEQAALAFGRILSRSPTFSRVKYTNLKQKQTVHLKN